MSECHLKLYAGQPCVPNSLGSCKTCELNPIPDKYPDEETYNEEDWDAVTDMGLEMAADRARAFREER